MGKEKRLRMKAKKLAEGYKEAKEVKLMSGEQKAVYETTCRIAKQEGLTYQQVCECYD